MELKENYISPRADFFTLEHHCHVLQNSSLQTELKGTIGLSEYADDGLLY